MNSQKEVKRYLKTAEKNCTGSFKKKLRTDLKNHLYDYIEENPDSSFEDIVHHFGEPDKFADEYILAMDDIGTLLPILPTVRECTLILLPTGLTEPLIK